MTTETIIHSNAFNFLSFLENSVDPRTGQYTLAIQLPELLGNDLSGPALPLRLSFNPLSDLDSGFGVGWTLVLSQYTPATRMLSLHTGETFKVTGDGGQPAIRERKLDTFHFHTDSAERFRIVHKSGLVEHLHSQGPSDQRVALPVRVEAATGHAVTLGYLAGTTRLETLTDDTGLVLLKLSYASGEVRLDLHPGAGPGGTPLASYRMLLDSRGSPARRRPYAIELPTDEKASWRLEYTEVRGLSCLSKVSTPTGAVERIEYLDAGHRYPGDAHPALPRVTRHVIDPGAAQPRMVTRYKYTSNNFLGYGSGITWADNGEDNLYKSTDSAFTYGTVVEYLQVDDDEGNDDKAPVVRTMTSTFNRFHLMTLHVIDQAGHIQENETRYHEQPGKTFDEQPAYFQLPYAVTKRWKLRDDPTKLREEVVLTRFDEHGNSVLESEPAAPKYDANQRIDEASTLATTLFKVRTWYPAAGEPSDEPGAPTPWNCPPDPYGFSRHLRTDTAHPLGEALPGAQTLSTHYRYQALSVVASSSAPPGLLMVKEEQAQITGQQRDTLQVIHYRYLDQPDVALLHGRLETRVHSVGGLETTVCHKYEKDPKVGHHVLQTIQTITGFDHGTTLPDGSVRDACKTLTRRESVLIGQPLLDRDDNDVEIAYEYDALRRVTKETVAPNDPQFTSSRRYAYTLVSQAGGRAGQTLIDVKNVATRSWVDGLNREVSRERQDADNASTAAAQNYRPVLSAAYDCLGNQIAQTEYDWLDYDEPERRRVLELVTRYKFDNWGKACCETGPDGVSHYEQTDPIGTAESSGPIQTAWSQSTDGSHKSAVIQTWLNRFKLPVRVERFTREGSSYSVEQTFYDGLKRKVREVDARKETKRYAYDAFDRLVDETLADNVVVHRDYAAHSTEDLPSLISAAGIVLGEQLYDGLDRLVESITGGRRRLHFYAPGQRQPMSTLTPSGQYIDYEYSLQLTDEPRVRHIRGSQAQATYVFDSDNARLLRCEEQGLQLERGYFSTGEMKVETRVQDGQAYTMYHATSLLGRALSYTDVNGDVQAYHYDNAGRLEKTGLGTLTAEFDYDALGRLSRTHTSEDDQYLTTTLDYDEFGRECRRHFDINGAPQTLTQDYHVTDALSDKYLKAEDTLLRHEVYDYDGRGRLTRYTCTAPDAAYAPVDPYGKVIQRQLFRLDALDNITHVQTVFPGGNNMATYRFDNTDPAQLSSIENTHPDYPQHITLSYDADGNMTQDEAGRVLEYNALGQLCNVADPAQGQLSAYGYDPLGRLVSQGSDSGEAFK